MGKFEKITVLVTIDAKIDEVWELFNNPEDIQNWNFASDDWYCHSVVNDFRVGGQLKSTMAAKDQSFSFDFVAHYDRIEKYKLIQYHLDDSREISVTFEEILGKTLLKETFDAETENAMEMQKNGWQAILNNFKKFVEKN